VREVGWLRDFSRITLKGGFNLSQEPSSSHNQTDSLYKFQFRILKRKKNSFGEMFKKKQIAAPRLNPNGLEEGSPCFQLLSNWDVKDASFMLV